MAVLCLCPIQLMEAQSDAGYTIRELDVEVYSDGATRLEYLLEVEIDRARINISLPGEVYEDMLIKDDEGFLLDYLAGNNSVTIDVLGSERVEIGYTTIRLTNKTVATWSMSLTLPIEGSITLPPEATVIGMTPTPTAITMAGESITITMSSGLIELSYLLGVTGTREHANTLIKEAKDYIEEVKTRGIKTDEADDLLQLAEEEYRSGSYVKAEEYAKSAMQRAEEIEGLAMEAQTAIDKAESAIQDVQASDRTSGLEGARSMLEEAETLYTEGLYQEAQAKAEEAERAANASTEQEPQTTQNIPWMIIIGAIVAVTAFIYWFTKKDRSRVGVDLDLLFEENPNLREDEKSVIRYLAESPEGLFTSEIRDDLDIPRSTAWRMVQRLEEDGIIETDMVGRETHIRISSRYRSG